METKGNDSKKVLIKAGKFIDSYIFNKKLVQDGNDTEESKISHMEFLSEHVVIVIGALMDVLSDCDKVSLLLMIKEKGIADELQDAVFRIQERMGEKHEARRRRGKNKKDTT